MRSTGAPVLSAGSNWAKASAVKNAVTKFAQQIEPLRARLLWNQKIQINRVPDITEEDDRVGADEKAGQPSLGSGTKNRSNLCPHKSQILVSYPGNNRDICGCGFCSVSYRRSRG